MANPDIQVLNQRAAELRSLADHIESIVENPRTYSTGTMKTWSGPNAADVRGRIKSWQVTCAGVAKSLRDEAHQCSQEAKDLKNDDKT